MFKKKTLFSSSFQVKAFKETEFYLSRDIYSDTGLM